MRVLGLMVGAALLAPGVALANDTAAELRTSGLVFVTNDDIRMASEDLYISAEEVRITYRFENLSDEDQRILVAFPMPDIEGLPFSPDALPSYDLDNIFGFETRFEGVPVEAEFHQQVYAAGIERTDFLTELGVPLMPFASETWDALAALDQPTLQELRRLGLVIEEYYDAGAGWERSYAPIWTLRAAYSWEAEFPAGETVTVEHRYQPSVGGTTGVTFMYDNELSTREEYTRKYCMDDAFIAAVERTMTPDEPWSAPFFEQWISYVLSSGANWAGSIGDFRLVVDKGSEDNLVSFCGEDVTRIGPTTFEMRKREYVPWGDLDILILERVELYD